MLGIFIVKERLVPITLLASIYRVLFGYAHHNNVMRLLSLVRAY